MTTTDLSVCEGRRRWGAVEKARIVEESFAAGSSAIGVARRYNVNAGMIYAWRRQLRAGEPAAKDSVQFVPVAVSAVGDAPAGSFRAHDISCAVEVALRNGRVLRVPVGVAPGRASALADALERTGR